MSVYRCRGLYVGVVNELQEGWSLRQAVAIGGEQLREVFPLGARPNGLDGLSRQGDPLIQGRAIQPVDGCRLPGLGLGLRTGGSPVAEVANNALNERPRSPRHAVAVDGGAPRATVREELWSMGA